MPNCNQKKIKINKRKPISGLLQTVSELWGKTSSLFVIIRHRRRNFFLDCVFLHTIVCVFLHIFRICDFSANNRVRFPVFLSKLRFFCKQSYAFFCFSFGVVVFLQTIVCVFLYFFRKNCFSENYRIHFSVHRNLCIDFVGLYLI